MRGVVKGIEKLTSVRLAEILSERDIVPAEVITDALYSQERNNEAFTQVLINGGQITEWDLAKIVTESFNLPFLMAGNYQISDDAKERLPKETLFKHMIVPLDVFGDVVCVSMPVLTSFEQLSKIQKEHDCELFPYVGLVSENRRILAEMHKDYPKWADDQQKEREAAAKNRKPVEKNAEGDWMSIFDAGDQATKAPVQKDDG